MITETWWLNSELIVGRPAPQHRVIDGVVVHQRREVHELHHGRRRHDLRLRRALDRARQQRERGTEHLAAHPQQVLA